MTHQVIENIYPEISMRKNSITFEILSISKFYNKLIDIKDLRIINNKRFKKSSDVDRAVLKLAMDGLVVSKENSKWIITPKGIKFLYNFVSRNPTKNQGHEED